VDAQDASAALEIGEVDSDLAIKTSRTEKSRVKDIDTIGSSNGDDTQVSIETIHLHQNLIHSPFALLIASSTSRTTLTTDGVDLIDDARSVLPGLTEDVTRARSTNANKHLNQLRTRNAADERNSSLTKQPWREGSFLHQEVHQG
jgi:hypothetical protein